MCKRKGVKLSRNYVKLSCYYMIVRHSLGWQQFASTKKHNVKKNETIWLHTIMKIFI